MYKKKLPIITFIALLLGIAGGFFFPQLFLSINVIGTIYINLLKIMIVPILFVGIVNAMNTSHSKVFSITLGAIILFIVMFLFSFVLNGAFVTLLKPGIGFTFNQVAWENELANPSFKDFLLSLFPSNIITAMSENAILPTIIFAFAFGIALKNIKRPVNVLEIAFMDLKEIFNTILQWIMYLTPFAVFTLIGNTVATYGDVVILAALKYILFAWLGCIIILIIVMILPVWIFCKINPIEYVKKVSKIWLITLTTCSSAATLPNTIKVCNEDFGVPEYITNIVVPLGCTIHMCGGAVSFSLLAFFTAQMYGIIITPYMLFMMVFAALLINMGAPGIPGGGIVIGATYLSILGLPLTFIGFYAGIYRLLDMIYTTMNVTGDITANLIIKESFNEANSASD